MTKVNSEPQETNVIGMVQVSTGVTVLLHKFCERFCRSGVDKRREKLYTKTLLFWANTAMDVHKNGIYDKFILNFSSNFNKQILSRWTPEWCQSQLVLRGGTIELY